MSATKAAPRGWGVQGPAVAVLFERVDPDLDAPARVLGCDMLARDVTEHARMRAYLDLAKRGGWSVRVEYAQKGGYGRYYPVAARRDPATGHRAATCYTKMRGAFRAALACRLYHDLDIVNAHPVIALQLARRAGVPEASLERLARLVGDREACLVEVQRACKVSRDAAKHLYVRQMFKGSCDAWARDNNVDPAAVPAFPRALQADLDAVARAVVGADPRASEWQRRWKPHAPRPVATAFALALQEAEKECLMAMHEAAAEAGREVGAWIYDGLLVARRPSSSSGGAAEPALLRLMEARVLQRTGLRVAVVEKPMQRFAMYCEPPTRGQPAQERPGPEVERGLREALARGLLVDDEAAPLDLDEGSLAYDDHHDMVFTVGGGAQAGLVHTARLGAIVVGGSLRGALCPPDNESFKVGTLRLPGTRFGADDNWFARVTTRHQMEQQLWAVPRMPCCYLVELRNDDVPRGCIKIPVRDGDDDDGRHVVRFGNADLTLLDHPKRAAQRLSGAAKEEVLAKLCGAYAHRVLQAQMRVAETVAHMIAERAAESIGAAVVEQLGQIVMDAGGGVSAGICARPTVELVDPAYLAMREDFERDNFYLATASEYLQVVPGEPCPVRRTALGLMQHYSHLAYRATASGKWVRFVRIWVDDPGKRQYVRAAFAPPPATCPEDEWNAWGGLRAERLLAASVAPDAEGLAAFLELARLVAGGEEGYLLDWVADIVQRPGAKPGVAVVLFSQEQGTGKSMFAGFLVEALLGPAVAASVADPERDLLTRFSNARRARVLVNLDEVDAKTLTAPAIADRFKNLVTCATASFEAKGGGVATLPDACRYLLTTNNVGCVRVETTDRRFAVFKASTARRGDFAFWERTAGLLARDGTAVAVLRELRARKVDAASLRVLPRSCVHDAMRDASVPPLVAFLRAACFHLERAAVDNNIVTRRSAEWFKAFRAFCAWDSNPATSQAQRRFNADMALHPHVTATVSKGYRRFRVDLRQLRRHFEALGMPWAAVDGGDPAAWEPLLLGAAAGV